MCVCGGGGGAIFGHPFRNISDTQENAAYRYQSVTGIQKRLLSILLLLKVKHVIQVSHDLFHSETYY